MSYLTVEVEFKQGKIVPREPEKLPQSGKGLLTILSEKGHGTLEAKRIELPLIRGDGSRIINPTPEQLDASLWD